MAQVRANGEDVSSQFPDLRGLMNTAVQNHYEPDASFSSTTGILASRVAMALLDETDAIHSMHVPAPKGLPGGYPVQISSGKIEVHLPSQWRPDDAIEAMNQCHKLDGVDSIEPDGAVHFTSEAREILQAETGFTLPKLMAPNDIQTVAMAQIEAMNARFDALK